MIYKSYLAGAIGCFGKFGKERFSEGNECIRIFDDMNELLDHVKKFYLN